MALSLTPEQLATIPEIRREIDVGAQALYTKGVPAVAILSSMGTLSLLGPVGLITGPIAAMAPIVLFFGHMLALRWTLVGPAFQTMTTGRRFFARSVCKLGYVSGALWAYGFASAPVVGLLAGPGSYVVLTWGHHRYLDWQLDREQRELPVHLLEKVVMFVLATVAIVTLSVILMMTWVLASWAECLYLGEGFTCFVGVFPGF